MVLDDSTGIITCSLQKTKQPDLAVGDYVLLLGKPHMKKQQQLVVQRLIVLTEPQSEVQWWLEVLDYHRRVRPDAVATTAVLLRDTGPARDPLPTQSQTLSMTQL